MGLDVSTTTIGSSLIGSENGKFSLLEYDYYKPIKNDLFLSLHEVREHIIDRINNYKPDIIVIEDILKFLAGKSRSETIINLAIYNRTCGLACYEITGKDPVLLNVQTARSIIKPKEYKGKLEKQDVPAVIEKIFNIDFPYIYKKNKKIADESYDMGDSMCVALAYAGMQEVKKSP